MKDDIFSLILQAEKEYNDALIKAMKEGERYVGACKKKQADYIEELKDKWNLFEKSENEKFQKMLSDEEHKIDIITAEKKGELKERQKIKADIISERLKEEVLSLYGNS